jgi:hypothetical protein
MFLARRRLGVGEDFRPLRETHFGLAAVCFLRFFVDHIENHRNSGDHATFGMFLFNVSHTDILTA